MYCDASQNSCFEYREISWTCLIKYRKTTIQGGEGFVPFDSVLHKCRDILFLYKCYGWKFSGGTSISASKVWTETIKNFGQWISIERLKYSSNLKFSQFSVYTEKIDVWYDVMMLWQSFLLDLMRWNLEITKKLTTFNRKFHTFWLHKILFLNQNGTIFFNFCY